MPISDNPDASDMYRTNIKKTAVRSQRRIRNAKLIFVLVTLFVIFLTVIAVTGMPDASVLNWLAGLAASVGAGAFFAVLYLMMTALAE